MGETDNKQANKLISSAIVVSRNTCKREDRKALPKERPLDPYTWEQEGR